MVMKSERDRHSGRDREGERDTDLLSENET